MDFFHYRRPRRRFVGSAGVVGAMAGAFIAGKIMISCDMFRPGVTPNADIIDYWPGFLAGAAIGGAGLSIAARFVWAWLRSE